MNVSVRRGALAPGRRRGGIRTAGPARAARRRDALAGTRRTCLLRWRRCSRPFRPRSASGLPTARAGPCTPSPVTAGTDSNCSGRCAEVWPPARSAGGKPRPGSGILASMVGSMLREDGSDQLTFGGRPLVRLQRGRAARDRDRAGPEQLRRPVEVRRAPAGADGAVGREVRTVSGSSSARRVQQPAAARGPLGPPRAARRRAAAGRRGATPGEHRGRRVRAAGRERDRRARTRCPAIRPATGRCSARATPRSRASPPR